MACWGVYTICVKVPSLKSNNADTHVITIYMHQDNNLRVTHLNVIIMKIFLYYLQNL